MAAIAGLVVAGVCGLNTVAMAGTGGHGARSADAQPGLRSAGGPIVAFRIDVSHYPQVGVVVTVPDAQQGLTRRNFVVLTGAQSASPSVRQLSARNIQLVLAPDTALAPARWREEQAAAARFLVGLPDGAQTAVVDPAPPGSLAHGLTRDATASVAGLAGLPPGTLSPAARLATALSAFSPGVRVRRTAVLVVSSPSPLAAATAARLGRQLAASGIVRHRHHAARRPFLRRSGRAQRGPGHPGAVACPVVSRVPPDRQRPRRAVLPALHRPLPAARTGEGPR
jgi:hypothetical protein